MKTPETIAAMTRTAKKYHRAGVDALAGNQPEDAVRALRLAVELDPELALAWNDLGVVMDALGNAHEAIRCYKRALALRPASVEARSNLGMLMLQMELAQVLRRQAFVTRAALG